MRKRFNTTVKMKVRVAKFALLVGVFGVETSAFQQNAPASTAFRSHKRAHATASTLKAKEPETPDEVDVVVIGSGLAGLSCSALLSFCGKSSVVLESHDALGGALHTWHRRGFSFEGGASLYSGFSADRSPNPLKNIFQIIGEDCEWITYDR